MKKSILLVSSIVLLTSASAGEKRLVDCRLVTPKTTECKPYPSKFMYTEKLTYDDSVHKLIISKTLPTGPKPKLIKIIKVEDMIEKHLEVLDPVRFSGSQPSPLRKSAEEIEQEKLEKERQKEALLQEKKREETEAEKKKIIEEKIEKEKEEALKKKAERYAEYAVQSGDSLILIARRFKMTTKELLAENSTIKRDSTLNIGQKITIPLSQKEVDSIVKKRKKEKRKEKKSKLAQKLEKKYLYLNKKTRGKVLNEYDAKLFKTLRGKHKLRVQATAYTSHSGQTDSTPFLAAWNNRIRPGMKIIAVSRDLIKKYGLGNGKKVRIQGLPGYYTVRDKMNKRYTKRIDIYMGLNRRKALRWGRKRTIIYW